MAAAAFPVVLLCIWSAPPGVPELADAASAAEGVSRGRHYPEPPDPLLATPGLHAEFAPDIVHPAVLESYLHAALLLPCLSDVKSQPCLGRLHRFPSVMLLAVLGFCPLGFCLKPSLFSLVFLATWKT